jgi:hypothetical protein
MDNLVASCLNPRSTSLGNQGAGLGKRWDFFLIDNQAVQFRSPQMYV